MKLTVEQIEEAQESLERMRTLRYELDECIHLTEMFLQGKVTKEDVIEFEEDTEELWKL